MNKLFFVLTILLLLNACNKTEGPGGTSSITGFIKSQNHQNAKTEITEIIFVQGLSIEHGDYWILNNVIGAEQFYIYYDNPTWVSEADPLLSGRTGIGVAFNYSDSNVEIAENTMDELLNEASDYFTITRNVDVLNIINISSGQVTDADKMTSPFEFSTSQQGDSSWLKPLYPAIDEKIYLVYGDNSVYGELNRTGGDGEYQFDNLTLGTYSVYSISKDTMNGGTIKVVETVEITDKKTVFTAGEISILN